MAVATGVKHGDQGYVVITSGQTFAVFLTQVHTWNFSYVSEFFNRDVFGGTQKGHLKYRGMYDVTGTLEGYSDGRAFGAGHDPGTASSANLYLVERTTVAFASASPVVLQAGSVVNYGPAHITVSMTVDRKTGLNRYAMNFTNDGDWTETLTA